MSLDGDKKYKWREGILSAENFTLFFLSAIASHVLTSSHKSDERTTAEILVQALIIILKKVKQLDVQRAVKPNNSQFKSSSLPLFCALEEKLSLVCFWTTRKKSSKLHNRWIIHRREAYFRCVLLRWKWENKTCSRNNRKRVVKKSYIKDELQFHSWEREDWRRNQIVCVERYRVWSNVQLTADKTNRLLDFDGRRKAIVSVGRIQIHPKQKWELWERKTGNNSQKTSLSFHT